MYAELTIKALTADGETTDFSVDVYNIYDKTEDQFKTFINNTKNDFAEEACNDSSELLDFIAVTDVEFREE